MVQPSSYSNRWLSSVSILIRIYGRAGASIRLYFTLLVHPLDSCSVPLTKKNSRLHLWPSCLQFSQHNSESRFTSMVVSRYYFAVQNGTHKGTEITSLFSSSEAFVCWVAHGDFLATWSLKANGAIRYESSIVINHIQEARCLLLT